MYVCKYVCNWCQGTSLIVYIFPSPPPSVHDIHAFKTKEVRRCEQATLLCWWTV